MMPKYKLSIEYDGTRYGGWQFQKNTKSIQGQLLSAGQAIFQQKVDIQGAGRTDAGVHALGQVAHLATPKPMPPDRLQMEINDRLPFDIHVLSVEKTHPRFHARHDAESRSYLYQISRRRSAFTKRYVWWIKDPLNVKAMETAGQMLVGMHNFTSFADKAVDADKTKVLVDQVEIIEMGELILFRIRASHYLWKMVRRIVGTLAEVGRGNVKPQDITQLLETPSQTPARWTAPPSGLFLEQVLYKGDRWREPIKPATPLF